MIKNRLNLEKALEVILYITSSVHDTYTALKVLYFADKDHLSKYGRFICGESYIAMKDGPVPTGSYDLVKYARGVQYFNLPKETRDVIRIDGYDIFPQRKPNLDYLSESDIECIDEAIVRYGSLSFAELKRISHDEKSYQEAIRDDEIPFDSIVRSLPNSEELMEYLEDD